MSLAERIRRLAVERSSQVAVSIGDSSITFEDLDSWSDAVAHRLRAEQVELGDLVVVAVPNSVDWFVATCACWKIGAVPQFVSPRLPAAEAAAVLSVSKPRAVFGQMRHEGAAHFATVPGVGDSAPVRLADVVSPAWKAATSGGSTGTPKVIVATAPGEYDGDVPSAYGFAAAGSVLVPAPLYHNGPAVFALRALLAGSRVNLVGRFDSERVLDLVEAEHVDTLYLVPTMMKRMMEFLRRSDREFDLTSIDKLWHMAEPCPPAVKEFWIERLGADHVFELYSATEAQITLVITGREWLEHRGSVGRPSPGKVRILGADGSEVPPGTVGAVWIRCDGPATYYYLGQLPAERDGEYETLGDLGMVDEDGYLHLTGRDGDLIISGGVNVYPAEVEAALLAHPMVGSCAVFGVPDDDRGERVHAVVETTGELRAEDLQAHAESLLVRYKVPRGWSFVDYSLRDEVGKIRRTRVRDEWVSRLLVPSSTELD